MDNNQYGPLTEEDVVGNIQSGRISKEALIWDGLMSQWLKIMDVPRYSCLFDLPAQEQPRAALEPNIGTIVDFSSEDFRGHKRFIRIKKMLSISYCIIDPKTKQPVSDFRDTVTLNISGSGLAFRETDAPITPGIQVDLRIKFPKIAHPFRIFGEVTRILEIEDGKAFDIGIRFTDMSENLQKHFLYYLQTLLAEAPDTN